MEENNTLSDQIQKAVDNGRLDEVTSLINSHKLSLSEDEEYTVLSTAVTKGHVEIVKFLLQSGVKVFATSGKPTLLQLAADNENIEVVEMLLKNGAHRDAIDRRYSAPASARCNVDMLKLFVSHGFDLNARDRFGWGLLHNAASDGDLDGVIALLNCGADADARDYLGRTPMYVAAGRKRRRVVTMLLKYGADINVTDKRNKTPLESVLDEFNTKSLPQQLLMTLLDVLQLHLKKMLSVNVYVSDANLEALRRTEECLKKLMKVTDKAKERQIRDWEEELARMKRVAVYEDCGISFYDLLTKSIHPLAMLFHNERIVEGVESFDYVKEFPIYGSTIKGHFGKAMERKKLFEKACEILYGLGNDLPDLPIFCLDRIFSSFSRKELEFFVDGFRPKSAIGSYILNLF